MAKIFGYHVVQKGHYIEVFRSRKLVASAVLDDDEKVRTVRPKNDDSKAIMAFEDAQTEIRKAYEKVGAGCPQGAETTDYLIRDILYLNRSLQSAINAAPYFEDTLYLNVFVKKRKSSRDRGLMVYISSAEPITKLNAYKIEGVANRWAVFKGPKFNSNSIMLGEIPMDVKRGKRKKESLEYTTDIVGVLKKEAKRKSRR